MIPAKFTLTTGSDTQPITIANFASRNKLRSHTVNHFCHSYERAAWDKFCPQGMALMLNAADKLRDMGCPFFHQFAAPERPPCHNCHLWHECTPIIAELELHYQTAIQDSCTNAVKLPRYLSYQDIRTNKPAIWFLCDNQILTKTQYCNEEQLTVVTSFALKQTDSWSIHLARSVRDAKKQAYCSMVEIINSECWGVADSTAEGGYEDKKKRKQSKRTAVKTKYNNWRKQLDDMYEE